MEEQGASNSTLGAATWPKERKNHSVEKSKQTKPHPQSDEKLPRKTPHQLAHRPRTAEPAGSGKEKVTGREGDMAPIEQGESGSLRHSSPVHSSVGDGLFSELDLEGCPVDLEELEDTGYLGSYRHPIDGNLHPAKHRH